MGRYKWILIVILLIWPTAAAADGGPGQRTIYKDEPCKLYYWDLMDWDGQISVCRFVLYNQGPPTASEVRAFCGSDLSEAWFETAQVSPDNGAPDTGFYTLLNKVEFSTCKTASHLPPVKVTHHITGNKLIISASEPIQGAEVISISGYYGQHPFECNDNSCEVTIIPTDGRGVKVWYQVISTASEDPTARQDLYIRYQPPADPELVDQDHGSAAQQIWGSFIPQDPPAWLGSAEPSDVGYAYLAGKLISSGQVDASQCGSGGLLFNGYADICGLSAARPMLRIYQNKYNDPINQAAAAEQIPGQLIKSIIAAESQFWGPDQIKFAAGETGLGHLTHNGADTLLLWHGEHYQQICQPMFGPECDFGYTRLDGWQRAALQNIVMEDPGILTIARALVASAGQAGAVIEDITGQRPGAVLSHQDLWRAAVLNYHAGPGCLGAALREAKSAGYQLGWGSIGATLELYCPGAASYVETVTR